MTFSLHHSVTNLFLFTCLHALPQQSHRFCSYCFGYLRFDILRCCLGVIIEVWQMPKASTQKSRVTIALVPHNWMKKAVCSSTIFVQIDASLKLMAVRSVLLDTKCIFKHCNHIISSTFPLLCANSPSVLRLFNLGETGI